MLMTTKELLSEADSYISCKKDPTKSSDLPYIKCNHILHQSSKKNNFKLMETSISLEDLFTTSDQSKCIYELWGGSFEYNHNNSSNCLKDVFFVEELAKNIINKKTIFIFVGFEEYVIDQDDKTKYNKESISHATTLILWPSKINNTYNMFHFNPHGNYSKDICHYEKYITKYRKKTITLSMPLDVYVMCKIKDALNNEIQEYEPKQNITVQYDLTAFHNYWGPNLQVSDKEGLCFIYPVIYFKYICFNEDAGHIIALSDNLSRRLPSTSKLIQRGEWEKLFYLCLLETIQQYIPYVRNHKNVEKSIQTALYVLFNGSYENSIKVFEDFLENYTHISTKALLNSFVKTFKDNSINT